MEQESNDISNVENPENNSTIDNYYSPPKYIRLVDGLLSAGDYIIRYLLYFIGVDRSIAELKQKDDERQKIEPEKDDDLAKTMTFLEKEISSAKNETNDERKQEKTEKIEKKIEIFSLYAENEYQNELKRGERTVAKVKNLLPLNGFVLSVLSGLSILKSQWFWIAPALFIVSSVLLAAKALSVRKKHVISINSADLQEEPYIISIKLAKSKISASGANSLYHDTVVDLYRGGLRYFVIGILLTMLVALVPIMVKVKSTPSPTDRQLLQYIISNKKLHDALRGPQGKAGQPGKIGPRGPRGMAGPGCNKCIETMPSG